MSCAPGVASATAHIVTYADSDVSFASWALGSPAASCLSRVGRVYLTACMASMGACVRRYAMERRAVVVLLFAMFRGAAPAANVCPEAGVVLPGVAVEGARATPYTLGLSTLDACVASCNGSHWCHAVVFKNLGVSGNPTCGAANETCCCASSVYFYRLESHWPCPSR